ncbi:hypothetical protein RND71_039839 [Anisodus tanguticus]|uniref:Uncharacterized protein n=1 Tax=Anisodus tanguticus TaxID=243964 RepID=A0AAE1QXI5_9SOLA|nr:hypothetical protein RND71_039839 [Anisodus tanguticus]
MIHNCFFFKVDEVKADPFGRCGVNKIKDDLNMVQGKFGALNIDKRDILSRNCLHLSTYQNFYFSHPHQLMLHPALLDVYMYDLDMKYNVGKLNGSSGFNGGGRDATEAECFRAAELYHGAAALARQKHFGFCNSFRAVTLHYGVAMPTVQSQNGLGLGSKPVPKPRCKVGQSDWAHCWVGAAAQPSRRCGAYVKRCFPKVATGLCKNCKVISREYLTTRHKLLVIDLKIKIKKKMRVVDAMLRIKWGSLTMVSAKEMGERLMAKGAWGSSGDTTSMWDTMDSCI